MKYRRAVALEYQENDAAPLLALKGDALDSDHIVAIANACGVPVIERPALAQALDALELGEHVPERLYRAVALILAELERDTH